MFIHGFIVVKPFQKNAYSLCNILFKYKFNACMWDVNNENKEGSLSTPRNRKFPAGQKPDNQKTGQFLFSCSFRAVWPDFKFI